MTLLLAVILSAAALAGYQVDQLLREEEPVREIAGDLPEQEDFATAVSDAVVDDAAAELPDMASGAVDAIGGNLVESLVSRLADDEEVRAAWDETVQQTRADYAAQLEDIFHDGTSGDTGELAVAVDLEPLSEAVTAPLRDALDSTLGWLPFVEEDSFDVLIPDIVIDIEAAAPESTDPYTWATVAVLSQYWLAFAIAAGVSAIAGVSVGRGAGRWIGLAVAGMLVTGLGLWIALRIVSPEAAPPAEFDDAAAAILDHVQDRFTAWAQPAWWVYTGAGGAGIVLGVLGALLQPKRSATRPGQGVHAA